MTDLKLNIQSFVKGFAHCAKSAHQFQVAIRRVSEALRSTSHFQLLVQGVSNTRGKQLNMASDDDLIELAKKCSEAWRNKDRKLTEINAGDELMARTDFSKLILEQEFEQGLRFGKIEVYEPEETPEVPKEEPVKVENLILSICDSYRMRNNKEVRTVFLHKEDYEQLRRELAASNRTQHQMSPFIFEGMQILLSPISEKGKPFIASA